MKIVGVDPGSRVTGFAVIVWPHAPRGLPTVEDVGVVKSRTKDSHTLRIGTMHQALFQLLVQHQPKVCVMEQTFLGVNPQSALKLGQARGALIAAASRCQIPLEDLSPTEIKKGIGSSGRASKEEIRWILERRLNLSLKNWPLDASDALATAVSFMATAKALPYFA